MRRRRHKGGSLGKALRREIEDQGLSACEIAKLTSLHHSTVYRLLAGENVSLSAASRIADVIGMRLQEG